MDAIYIIPVGEVEHLMVQYLIDKLPEIFYQPFGVSEPMVIPPQSYDSARQQFLSSEILKSILVKATPQTIKILGITEVDLFIPIFTYVFGEAQLGGKGALVSLYRLKPRYDESTDEELYRLRALKESVHELGHTFGLTHCVEQGCVMNFANNIIQVDMKDYRFCPSCNDLIKFK